MNRNRLIFLLALPFILAGAMAAAAGEILMDVPRALRELR